MLLKKMKNSKAQAAFASWCEMVQMIQWERLEAKKQAAMDAMMAAEAARLAAELAGMQDNHAMKKLKMHFAKIAGLAKAQTFKALTISARQAKARKMLDGEAGKRLKAFLKSKLAGVLRRCYTAIIANHDNIAAENLKNNDKAKKVGMMLEKLARGMVHRIFTAFIRHFQECAEERAAQDAINARLSGLDEANRAKLKVFLMGKEKAQLMMFFKQWVMVASEKGLMELYEMLDKEEAMRIAAEAELAACWGLQETQAPSSTTFSTRSMQKTRLPLTSLTRPTPMLQICADLQRRSGSVRLMSSRSKSTVKSSKQRIWHSVKKLQLQLQSGTSWLPSSWVLLEMLAMCTTKLNMTSKRCRGVDICKTVRY